MSVRIVTDSTCDLHAETIDRYEVCVVPFYINVGRQGFLDGIDITHDEFYQKLPTFSEHPTTAVPSPQKFRAIYNTLADEGAREVLSIHMSVALSAMVNVARVAAQETTSTTVTVLDSRQLSLGMGFMVERAAQMAMNGDPLTDILAVLDNQMKRTHVFAVLDTLEYMRRSGRINRFMAGLGGLLQIKPILTMFDGKPGTDRVRTFERAKKRLLEMLSKVGALERLAIVHTHAPDRVAELRALVTSEMTDNDIIVADITPVIGTHIGPGAYGFAAIGK
jgi:DegV family protein with EDD domain